LAIVGQAICPEFVFISAVQICGATSGTIGRFEKVIPKGKNIMQNHRGCEEILSV
jgi:hypothetical protein